MKTGYNKKVCNRLFYKNGSNNFNKIYKSATSDLLAAVF
jgi:hypothetical protein